MTLSRWPHEFPKGYKQYRVMCEMLSENGLKYTEIIKFAFELSGEYKFDKVANRGYWSGAFQEDSGHRFYGSKVDGWITKYCIKGSDGKYRIDPWSRSPFRKLEKKFKGISAKRALEMKKDSRAKEVMKAVPPQPGSGTISQRVEEFKARYAEPLANFAARQEEKAMRITCSNGISINGETITINESPLVTNRGLKLDDEVIFYRKFNGETGEGYVASIKMYSKNSGNLTEISIGLINSIIPQITYNPETDTFTEMAGNNEIQIIKKNL